MKKSEAQKIFEDARQSIMDGLRRFVSENGGHVRLKNGCTKCTIADDDDAEGPRTTWFISLEKDEGSCVKAKGKSVDGYPDQLIFGEEVEFELWELTADELFEIIEALPGDAVE